PAAQWQVANLSGRRRGTAMAAGWAGVVLYRCRQKADGRSGQNQLRCIRDGSAETAFRDPTRHHRQEPLRCDRRPATVPSNHTVSGPHANQCGAELDGGVKEMTTPMTLPVQKRLFS